MVLEVHIEIWNMEWDSSNLGEYLTFNLKFLDTCFNKTQRGRPKASHLASANWLS
jgi:hypothetical protein